MKLLSTNLLDLNRELRKLSQQSFRDTRRDAKLCAPYLEGKVRKASEFSGLMQIHAHLMSAKCRIVHFPKVIQEKGSVRFIRYRSPKGHRSVFNAAINERPRPLIFDNQVLGGARAYWDTINQASRLMGVRKRAWFIRFDVAKAYPNITGQMILRAHERILKASGQDIQGRRFLVEQMQLKRLLETDAADLFMKPRQQEGLFLGQGISKHLAQWVYWDLSLQVPGDCIFRFEDDFILVFRPDARNPLDKRFTQLLEALDRFGLSQTPQKMQSGALGIDELQFLGFKAYNNSLKVEPKRLGQVLWRLHQWLGAHKTLPKWQSFSIKLNRSLGYFKAATNQAELHEGMRKAARRLYRIHYADRNQHTYTLSCQLLPRFKLNHTA